MNIATIEMPAEQAREKLAAYRAQLQRRADAEYEMAAAGYKALADGKVLINLTDTLHRGGLGSDYRPRLAVSRADRREVEFTWDSGRAAFDTRGWRGRRGNNLTLLFPWPNGQTWGHRGFAMVPMVPADVRPNVDMRDCFILWEVEKWADRSAFARPDRDPYLLRHIAGDLYAVLAQWDLTELERAVMAERIPA